MIGFFGDETSGHVVCEHDFELEDTDQIIAFFVQAIGSSMFAVDQDNDILHLDAILFQERSSFENAAAACDQVVNDQSSVICVEMPFDAALPGSFWATARVNKRNVRFERIGCCQEQPSDRDSCDQFKRMDARAS